MPTINQLSAITTLSGSDLLPVYSAQNGDSRKISVTNLMAYLQASFASPEFVNQYSAPAATGFTVTVNDSSDNTWLIISPVAGYADGAITLPAVANCVDGQEIAVNCSQAVTAFVVNGNGAIDVLGEPTTLAAGAYFRLRYNATTKIWYRVA